MVVMTGARRSTNGTARKPGVVMAMKLTVSAFASGTAKEEGSVERTLWVFPPDPFTGRAEWLKKLDIRLFDPVGATARLFDEVTVPYTTVRNVDALGEPKDAVLVVPKARAQEVRAVVDALAASRRNELL